MKNQRKSPAKAGQRESYETLGVRPEGCCEGEQRACREGEQRTRREGSRGPAVRGSRGPAECSFERCYFLSHHVLEREPCRFLGTWFFSYLLASGTATRPPGFKPQFWGVLRVWPSGQRGAQGAWLPPSPGDTVYICLL